MNVTVKWSYGGTLLTKHFRGVEQFQELSSSLGFIRSEATVRVSHAKKLYTRQETLNEWRGCLAETLQGCVCLVFIKIIC